MAKNIRYLIYLAQQGIEDPAQLEEILGEWLYETTRNPTVKDDDLKDYDEVCRTVLNEVPEELRERVGNAFLEGRKILYKVWFGRGLGVSLTTLIEKVIAGHPIDVSKLKNNDVVNHYIRKYIEDAEGLKHYNELVRQLKESPTSRFVASKIRRQKVVKLADLLPEGRATRREAHAFIRTLEKSEIITIQGGPGGRVVSLNHNKRRILDAYFEGWMEDLETSSLHSSVLRYLADNGTLCARDVVEATIPYMVADYNELSARRRSFMRIVGNLVYKKIVTKNERSGDIYFIPGDVAATLGFPHEALEGIKRKDLLMKKGIDIEEQTALRNYINALGDKVERELRILSKLGMLQSEYRKRNTFYSITPKGKLSIGYAPGLESFLKGYEPDMDMDWAFEDYRKRLESDEALKNELGSDKLKQ